MNCIYCFAKFKNIDAALPKRIALKIPSQLVELGIEKINFSGGEPLLYPHLMDVIKECKRCDLTVAIISNGTFLTSLLIEDLAKYIDWIGISLDSNSDKINTILGRKEKISSLLQKSILIKNHDIGLKINTVVTKINMHEDMRSLIKRFNPERWKVFQVMKRIGENDDKISKILVSDHEFINYSKRNTMVLENGTTPRFENNDNMRTSYLMLDPLGRFFHSPNGPIEYIDTDFQDITNGIDRVVFDYEAFVRRGGIYDWKRKNYRETRRD